MIYCRADAAFITSPGFPAAIQPADRRWIIEGQIGQYIILEFVHLDIWHEGENNIVLCSNNYVIVDDVALNGQRTEKGRYCSAGTSIEKIQSSWHMMELRYLIEKSEGGVGFMAMYTIIDFVMKESDEATNGRLRIIFTLCPHPPGYCFTLTAINCTVHFFSEAVSLESLFISLYFDMYMILN